MIDNSLQRIENENENDLIYNDNFIPNYEEQACCQNLMFSAFGNNSILSYINDICFKDIPINDQEIINEINQEVKTPLCSNKKKTPNEYNNNVNNNNINNSKDNIDKESKSNSNSILNIGNENNNILINNERNYNLIRNSLASNPSNDSAAEPIMAIRRNNTMDTKVQNKNKKIIINNNNNTLIMNNTNNNFFTKFAEIFKDFFNKKEKNENEDDKSESQLSLKKRPILRRILNKDINSPLRINNFKNYKIKSNNKNNSFKNEKREILYDDILILKTSEDN